jgi:hypothetical protein
MSLVRSHLQQHPAASSEEDDLAERLRPSWPSLHGASLGMRLGTGQAKFASPPANPYYPNGDPREQRESMLSLDVVDLDSEVAYWRSHYRGLVPRPGLRYSDHEPAIKLGLDAYMRGHGRHIDEMHDELRDRYRRTRGGSRLDWDEARPVVAAAWRRLSLRGNPGSAQEPIDE